MPGKSILIVDDSLDLQGLLESILSGAGYSVHSVSSGREALQWLGQAMVPPDLIMLDLMMPDIDGYEFRARQVKDPNISAIPVIVMTADMDGPSILERTHAQGLLSKPFLNIDLILQAVRRLL